MKSAPTFLLRGVNFAEIWRRYTAGACRTLEPPCRVLPVDYQPLTSASHGPDAGSPTHAFRDKHNALIVFATSNHAAYAAYGRSERPPPARCDCCKRDIEGLPVPIPVRLEERLDASLGALPFAERGPSPGATFAAAAPAWAPPLPPGAAEVRPLLGRGAHALRAGAAERPPPDPAASPLVYLFWGEGEHCSFECALAVLRRQRLAPLALQDVTYQTAEGNLLFLYRLVHPGEPPLVPAADPRLAPFAGGGLEDAEWAERKHTYRRTPCVHVAPLKVDYVRGRALLADGRGRAPSPGREGTETAR